MNFLDCPESSILAGSVSEAMGSCCSSLILHSHAAISRGTGRLPFLICAILTISGTIAYGFASTHRCPRKSAESFRRSLKARLIKTEEHGLVKPLVHLHWDGLVIAGDDIRPTKRQFDGLVKPLQRNRQILAADSEMFELKERHYLANESGRSHSTIRDFWKLKRDSEGLLRSPDGFRRSGMGDLWKCHAMRLAESALSRSSKLSSERQSTKGSMI
jgi:hypothetical protein